MISKTVQGWLDQLDEAIQEGRLSRENVERQYSEVQGEEMF